MIYHDSLLLFIMYKWKTKDKKLNLTQYYCLKYFQMKYLKYVIYFVIKIRNES
jgi:hypothetical protein